MNWLNILLILPIVLFLAVTVVVLIFIHILKSEQTRIEYIATYDLAEYHAENDRLESKKNFAKKFIMGSVYIVGFLMILIWAFTNIKYF